MYHIEDLSIKGIDTHSLRQENMRKMFVWIIRSTGYHRIGSRPDVTQYHQEGESNPSLGVCGRTQ